MKLTPVESHTAKTTVLALSDGIQIKLSEQTTTQLNGYLQGKWSVSALYTNGGQTNICLSRVD